MTALGLLSPLGSVGTLSAMAMATKAHAGKPFWAQEGVPELATLYGAIAAALALLGPGRYSLDRRLGIRASWQLTALALVGGAAAAAYGMTRQPSPTDEPQTSRDESNSLVVPQRAAGLD